MQQNQGSGGGALLAIGGVVLLLFVMSREQAQQGQGWNGRDPAARPVVRIDWDQLEQRRTYAQQRVREQWGALKADGRRWESSFRQLGRDLTHGPRGPEDEDDPGFDDLPHAP